MLTLLLLWAAPPPANADTKIWDGSLNTLWSVGDNWSGNVSPVDGDEVVFPAAASNKNNTNDKLNLRLRSLRFTDGGYSLGGNSVTITNGVRAEQASGGSTINFDIYLGGSQTFECINAGVTLAVNGFIELGSSTLTVANNGDVTFAGQISGAGGVVKHGSGTLTYLGNTDNYYYGPTDLRGGLLVLGKTDLAESLANSRLTISNATVRLSAWHQIGGLPITINKSGMLDLSGFNESIGTSLMLNDGGEIQTGTGTLSLTDGATITVAPGPGAGESSTISGNLLLYGSCTFDVVPAFSIWPNGLSISATVIGASPLHKTGNGIMYLSASNLFTGPFSVEAGTLAITHSHALGDAASGTTVSNTATLRLSENLNVSGEALTLASTNVNGAVECTGGTNIWDGTVTLGTDAVINISTNARLNLAGAVGGTGGLTKTGPGTLTLSGSAGNSYTGKTTVEEGVLELGKSAGNAIFGAGLIVGDGVGWERTDVVRYLASNQILDSMPINIASSGLLDLNGYNDKVGPLKLDGGDVITGIGLLTLNANVTVVANTNALPTISGNLSLGGVVRTFAVEDTPTLFPDFVISATVSSAGGLLKTGPGALRLDGANTYSGFTLVEAGILEAYQSLALGSSSSGTVVNNEAILYLSNGAHITNETLTLKGQVWNPPLQVYNGTNSWGGSIELNADSVVRVTSANNLLTINGSIAGAGGLTKDGLGTLVLSGASANTYSGNTFVNSGTLELAKSTPDAAIPGTLVIGDNMGGAGADIVRVVGYEQIHDLAAVTANSSGALDVSGVSASDVIGSLAGSGQVVLGSKRLDVGKNDASTTYSGLISGAGGSFYKQGLGTLILSGDNTYSGETTVLQGTLLVNGSQPASLAGTLPGAILGGTGTVGDIIAYGVLSPGTSPGIFTCSNVALNASSTFRVELNGILPGVFGYDQLNVRGRNYLGGAALEVALGFTPAKEDAFTILNNDGHDAIVGSFAGLTNGATFSVGLADFRINYDGGTGNDVVLTTTRVYPALVITSVTQVGTNLALRWTGSRPDYVVEKATGLGTNLIWQAVAGPMEDTKATVPMDTTNGFYRVRGGN